MGIPPTASNPYGSPYPMGLPPAASTGTSSTLPGAQPFNYNSAYGGIPQVPNPIASLGEVLTGNIGQLGSLYNLAKGVGSANAAGAGTALEANAPGTLGNIATAGGNITSLLHGQIPQDVQNLIAQQAAERGVAIGSPDSANASANLLRSLGLTSLGLQSQGLSNLGSLIGMTPTGPAFNAGNMLVDPNQQQAWQYLANMLNAAPIPGMAARANQNAFGRGLGAGQGAGGGPTGGLGLNSGNLGTDSGALGFGFGTYGGHATAPPPGSTYNDYETWNPENPDPWSLDMGSGDQTSITMPGYDATQTLMDDASNPDYWDIGNFVPTADAGSEDYWSF